MDSLYVQARDGNLYVGLSRVTLETVILSWQAGQTPEQIHASFSQLLLVAIYGAITYYLEHKDELDAFFRETEAMDEARQAAEEAAHPEFFADMRRRMAEARRRLNLESPVP